MEQCKTPFDIYKPVPVYKDITETKTTSKLKFEHPRIVFGKKKAQDFSFFILMLLLIFILAVGVCVLSPIIFVFSFTLMFVIAVLYYDDCKQIQQEILIHGKFSIKRIKTVETVPKERIVVNQKEIDVFNKLTNLRNTDTEGLFFKGHGAKIIRIRERLKNHETLLTSEQLWFINNSLAYLIELYEAYDLVVNNYMLHIEVIKSIRDSLLVFNDKLNEIDKKIEQSIYEESIKKIDFVNACLKRV